MPYRPLYNWLSHHGLFGAAQVAARVASVTLGEHAGFMVINRRLKATAEHPFMIRRGDEWGFASAEFVQPGDYLIDDRMDEELVESVVRIDAPTRTVALHIPGTNTLLAEGVWVHNDMPAGSASSGVAEATAQSSGPGSASGTGMSTASGSGSPSGSASSSGSSSSGSGSKSSGSSLSSSGSGSGSGSSSSGGGTGTYTI